MQILTRNNYDSLPEAGQRPAAKDHPGTFRPHVGKHALIVEDNVLNAEVLATLLGKYGLASTVLETPVHLEETLESLTRVDVVFLDLEFRDHNGFDVNRQLHNHPRMQNIPVVAYTVHTSEIDRARREGFHSFLGKPIKQERFEEQLNRILSNQPVWDA
jgi:CheY-like chemotaxis protein